MLWCEKFMKNFDRVKYFLIEQVKNMTVEQYMQFNDILCEEYTLIQRTLIKLLYLLVKIAENYMENVLNQSKLKNVIKDLKNI